LIAKNLAATLIKWQPKTDIETLFAKKRNKTIPSIHPILNTVDHPSGKMEQHILDTNARKQLS
jgi:hypothetical protein